MIIFSGIAHIIIGVGLYVYFFTGGIFGLFFVVLGAILPDMDIKYSMIGKLNPFANLMKHRGRTHTVMYMVLLSVPIFIYNRKFGMSFGFGYLSHLLADGITPMGIMWLYPYSKKYYSIFPSKHKIKIH